MLIKSLNINNLRNVSAAVIRPHEHLNLFHGANGAGKTSILEALVVLSKGRSFRSGQVGSLIGPGGDRLRVVATIEPSSTGAERRLGVERGNRDWRGRIDGEDVAQVSAFTRLLPFVLLEPNSHLLISGPPETRRRFLDWGVFHVKHGHLDTWRRYTRALKQRNAALRLRNRELVESLAPQMERLGRELDQGRRVFLERLAPDLRGSLATLSPDLPELTLCFQPGWTDGSLAEALAAALERDLERGNTSVGPHRADLDLRVESTPARDCLSRGEQKILAAGLLLTQARLMHEGGNRPVLLLDDLASEFDAPHREAVMAAGRAQGYQIWVTGTSLRAMLPGGEAEAAVFHVKHGEVEQR